MSTVVKTFRKAAIERRRLYLDYSCWLEESEMLIDLQVIVSPDTPEAPIAITSGYTDVTQKKLVIFASGGLPNTDYILSMRVRTDEGQVKKDDLGLRVTP